MSFLLLFFLFFLHDHFFLFHIFFVEKFDDAYKLIANDPDSACKLPLEFIVKAIVNTNIGQRDNSQEHLKTAQSLFQLIGSRSVLVPLFSSHPLSRLLAHLSQTPSLLLSLSLSLFLSFHYLFSHTHSSPTFFFQFLFFSLFFFRLNSKILKKKMYEKQGTRKDRETR